MTSPYGPMVLIVNAHAGRGKVGKALPEIRENLDRRGLEYDIYFTRGRADATRMARESLAEGVKFLVAVGGDGTVHELVNGMMEDDQPVAPDAVFGVVGAGTGCDFIKTFGIPAMPAHAVAHLDGGNSFPIDVGKITFQEEGQTITRYFANIAEAGLGADIVRRAQRLPRWLGPAVYAFAFWLTIRKFKTAQVRVDLVDRTYEGPMNNLIVANGQFFGGGMKIAPKAAPTDALLDVQIEHARKREALALIQKVFRGEHLPHPKIQEAKRARLAIEADRPLLIEADGEVLGHTPATFEVLPNALSLKV